MKEEVLKKVILTYENIILEVAVGNVTTIFPPDADIHILYMVLAADGNVEDVVTDWLTILTPAAWSAPPLKLSPGPKVIPWEFAVVAVGFPMRE